MQDMIKKIVDMDEKAQEITEEAKRTNPRELFSQGQKAD